jgi:acyl dehydratase
VAAFAVGQAIPEYVVENMGFMHWNRFASVNDEFVPIHMDDEAGRAAGYPSSFGMGNLQWSILHDLVRQVVGDDGRIRTLMCTFRGPNLKGQSVRAGGTVTGVENEDGVTVVSLDIWTRNEAGEDLAPGTAVVELPGRG